MCANGVRPGVVAAGRTNGGVWIAPSGSDSPVLRLVVRRRGL